MSIVRCVCCDEERDTDTDDGSYSDDGDYLCENCSDEEEIEG